MDWTLLSVLLLIVFAIILPLFYLLKTLFNQSTSLAQKLLESQTTLLEQQNILLNRLQAHDWREFQTLQQTTQPYEPLTPAGTPDEFYVEDHNHSESTLLDISHELDLLTHDQS